MSQTSHKKQGRFIKNDDPVRKVLNITDFNLMDICEKPFTYHDNAAANVIHQRLHSEDDLAEGVRDSYEIDSTFPHESRPVIRPLDFTDEWRRQKKRMASRNHRLDDEEELDDGQSRESVIDLLAAKYSEIADEIKSYDPFFYFLPEFHSAPRRLLQEAAPLPKVAATRSNPAAASPARSLDTEIFKAPAHEPMHQESFIPMAPQHQLAPPPKAPEIDEAELEEIRKTAEASGYQHGFQLGEEKGTLAAQQKIVEIVEQLGMVLENLHGMQASILTSVQDNFAMICQSLIEGLLQREINIDPEILGKIIERAVAEALPADEYRIHVSAKAFKSLAQWSNQSLRENLRIDESLSDFAFRVDGKHAVVEAKLSDIIKGLLERTDLNLFEAPASMERAS